MPTRPAPPIPRKVKTFTFQCEPIRRQRLQLLCDLEEKRSGKKRPLSWAINRMLDLAFAFENGAIKQFLDKEVIKRGIGEESVSEDVTPADRLECALQIIIDVRRNVLK